MILKHQTCKKCGKEQRFEFSIKDEIWKKLPLKWQNKELCIECFLELLENNLTKPIIIHKSDFVFMGCIGTTDKLTGILIDTGRY